MLKKDKSTFKSMQLKDLKGEMIKLKESLMKLRFLHKRDELKNTSQLKSTKKKIALVNTLMCELKGSSKDA